MLAEAQLSPAAKTEFDRLLSLEPGQTLASISTWADEHRNPSTAAWHYANFPRGNCSYEPERDCPDGKYVVGAIERQIQVLRIADNDEKRLLALKYVVHLIGDIHQPFQAGFGDDRGGNNYQLQISCGAATSMLYGIQDSSRPSNRRRIACQKPSAAAITSQQR